MGLRFFKRFKILPGVTLNMSKSGMSVSLGPRGAKYTIGPRGERITIGLPGTGLYYTVQSKKPKKTPKIRVGDYDSPGIDYTEPKPTRNYNPIVKFNPIQRLLYPTYINEFVNAFVSIAKEDYEEAFEHAKKSAKVPDGSFLAAYIAIQLDNLEVAESYMREAIKKPRELGLLLEKVNFPFVAMFPIATGITYPLEGIMEESAFLFLSALAVNKGDYQEALSLIDSAIRIGENRNALKVYKTKILIKSNPDSVESLENILWLKEVLRNQPDEDSDLKTGISEIVTNYNATLTRDVIDNQPNPILGVPQGIGKYVNPIDSIDANLGMLVGVDEKDNPKTVDLCTEHNVLIIGEQYSGKSSVMHTILLSSLLTYSPQDLKCMLCDPRGLEFFVYDVPHLAHLVAKTYDEFNIILDALAEEINYRVTLFRETCVKSISAFNKTTDNKLSRIVIMIDNLDDYFVNYESRMASLYKLSKIAEYSRVCGIHIIASISSLSSHKIEDINMFGCKILLAGSDTQNDIDKLFDGSMVPKYYDYEMMVKESNSSRIRKYKIYSPEQSDFDLATDYWQ